MMNDIAVEFKNVFEKYDVEIVLDGKSTRESFEALRDISFSIRKGESVAIIGPNGAGKSTLLRLIAGLLRPEKGDVRVNGRVGSLLDLGAGFHPELTGRDNLLLNASLYNFSREELDSKYDQILAFADIGKFINAPVRCYSQGMYVRLAFSLAIHVDPDILLIDDCLSVGDDNFRAKSLDKALELKAKKKTIVFVTHDFTLARQMCERGIYIRESRIIADANIETAVSRYLKPLEVDKERYKYLGAKILEEEKRREEEDLRKRGEEKGRLEEEEARRRLEEEKRWEEKRHEEEEGRRRLEEEKLRGREEKLRLEKERRREGRVLSRDGSFRLVISPARVQIFHKDHELTAHEGVRATFMIGPDRFNSSDAIWRIKKVSEGEVLCFLRWERTKNLSQIWSFKLLSDGAVGLEIMMPPRASLPTENEILEYCVKAPCEILDEKRWRNKARVFSCGFEPGLKLETLQENQICGIAIAGKEFCRPYFLTIPERSSPQNAKERRVYFKGRFSFGGSPTALVSPVLTSPKARSGRTGIEFHDGSCQLSWGEKPLTAGLGIYTSLYSKGTWCDSTQARWRAKESSPDRFVMEGFWPWIPISQVWEVLLQDEKTILLNIKMKVFREASIRMQETVTMLTDEYKRWSLGKETKEFPEDFTRDDFFRYCLGACKADGVSSLSAFADFLPEVIFKPSFMEGYQMIAENSAHIYDTRARLFHCVSMSQKEEACWEPGEYEFFKGSINIKEENV